MSAFERIRTKYRQAKEEQKLSIVRDGINLFKRIYGSDERFKQHFQEAEEHLSEKDHSGALSYLAFIDVIANQKRPFH